MCRQRPTASQTMLPLMKKASSARPHCRGMRCEFPASCHQRERHLFAENTPCGHGVADALELLESPHMADGSRNPLFRPILYRQYEGKPKRLRRICCIRYLINGLDYCKTCPCLNSRSSPMHDACYGDMHD
ncbi:hypothetical protein FY157_25450 (plasmid) [Agrobacterium tumefaciens]|nr:hypothetical protein FY157_25450 [Agrobacterium tumefaciens]